MKKVAKDTQEELLVSDAKLGNCIKEKYDIPCLANTPVQELMRGIRSQIDGLISGIPAKEMTAFALGQSLSCWPILPFVILEFNMYCFKWYYRFGPQPVKIQTEILS